MCFAVFWRYSLSHSQLVLISGFDFFLSWCDFFVFSCFMPDPDLQHTSHTLGIVVHRLGSCVQGVNSCFPPINYSRSRRSFLSFSILVYGCLAMVLSCWVDFGTFVEFKLYRFFGFSFLDGSLCISCSLLSRLSLAD